METRKRRTQQHVKRMLAIVMTLLTVRAVSGAGLVNQFEDDFTSNPLVGSDWHIEALNSVSVQAADPPLMTWNATSQLLSVVWDHAQPSSVFGASLGRTVTDQDDFSFSFRLTLDSVTNPDGDFFEIAIGLDDSTATRTRVFDRGGQDFFDPADPRRVKNIVDWSWVPPFDVWSGGTASFVMPTICPDPGDGPDLIRNHWGYVLSSLELQPGHTYTIEQTYSATSRTLWLRMFEDGHEITTEDITTPIELLPSDTFTVDRFAVKSYHNRYAFGEWVVTGQVDDVAVVINGETVLQESFTTDPASRWVYTGLRDYGLPQRDLVSWDADGKRLLFTWDAARDSTAFSRALPAPVTDADSFVFEFDIELTEITINGDFFEIAVGLRDSTAHLFDRSGKNFFDPEDPTRCKNLVEWNWIPPYDAWGGGTDSFVMSTVAADPEGGPDVILNHWGYVLLRTELTTGVLYHVRQQYDAETRRLTLEMTADGTPLETEDIAFVIEVPPSRRFRVDRFGPVSYFNSYAMQPGDWKIAGALHQVRFERRFPRAAANPTWVLFE